MSTLTKHQKRVLVALRALETVHGWPWWTRDTLGQVVGAGGYHSVIQVRTIATLKRAGLVQTQRSSWDDCTRQAVRCWCATYRWGLTDAGRELAAGMNVSFDEATQERLGRAQYDEGLHYDLRDEDEPPPGFDDDDDDGPGPVPAPPLPDLVHA